jgi:hypothetical protein
LGPKQRYADNAGLVKPNHALVDKAGMQPWKLSEILIRLSAVVLHQTSDKFDFLTLSEHSFSLLPTMQLNQGTIRQR